MLRRMWRRMRRRHGRHGRRSWSVADLLPGLAAFVISASAKTSTLQPRKRSPTWTVARRLQHSHHQQPFWWTTGGEVSTHVGSVGHEATSNAGIFGNDSQGNQSVTDFPNFALRPNVSSSKSGAAFVGETNLTALYRLSNTWNLRAGYNAIWLGGLCWPRISSISTSRTRRAAANCTAAGACSCKG